MISANEIEKSAGIVASLSGVSYAGGTYKPKNQVVVDKRLAVISRVALVRPADPLLMAYSSSTVKGSFIQLHGIGGSGAYEWKVKDSKVASSNIYGKLTALGLGSTVLTLIDKTNPRNTANVTVQVDEIAENWFLERNKELEDGKKGLTAVYATNSAGSRYTSCLGIDYKPLQTELGFFRVTSAPTVNVPEFAIGLAEEGKKNSFLLDQLTAKGKYRDPSHIESLYKDYFSSGELTKEKFAEIVKAFTTYGLCGVLQLTAITPGEAKHSVTVGDSQAGFQTVRVVAHFSNMEPKAQQDLSSPAEYLVAFDSRLSWSLVGGPHLWKQAKRPKDELIIKRLDGDKAKAIDAAILGEDLSDRTRTNISVHCHKNQLFHSSHYSIKLTRKNQADEDLIMPLELSTELIVVCSLPDYLELFEVGEGRLPFSNLNHRSDYFRPTTLRNNRPYDLQVWAFDSHYKPFYNFSSLWFDWSSSNEGMAKYFDIHENRQRASLKVGAEVGRATLVTQTDSYRANHRQEQFKAVRKEIAVDVMNTVFLEPTEKLLYNDKNASFNITVHKGSGKFRVLTNTSAVIEVHESADQRTLTVKPKAIGDCLVTVEDLQLVSLEKASCVVRVRNAYSLQLDIPQRLAVVNSTASAHVQVTDKDGRRFDDDQLHFMKLSLSTDGNLNAYQHPLSIKRKSASSFLLQGQEAGSYNLVAFLESFAGNAASNYETLEIFSPIRTIPHQIINAPGCISTVQITGGPSHQAYANFNISLRHTQKTERVCKITKELKRSFEIESAVIGTEHIVFDLLDAHGKVLSSTTLHVVVDHIEEYRVLNMENRRIHVDAPVRLISHGIIGGKEMTPSFCGFKYTWTIKNPEILALGDPLTTTAHQFHDTTSLLAINATGIREGLADISLEVEQMNALARHKLLKTTLTVQVIQPVNVLSPTYVFHEFGKNNHMILPPKSFYKVVTTLPHHNMDFRLLHSAIPGNVQVTPRGGIRVGDQKGEGVVVISDRNNPDQISYVNVRIVDVYSILVENSYKADIVPVGAEISLKIDLQNENGFLFPQPLEGVNLVAVSTNLGIVSISFDENQSHIKITGKTTGSTFVILYLESNPFVYDIFRVEVGSIVQPAGPLRIHAGGHIHFVLNNSKIAQDKIIWESEDSSIIHVDPYSGFATARSPGTTNVVIKDLKQYSSPVVVFQADSLTLSNSCDRRLTSNPTNPTYRDHYDLVFEAKSNGIPLTHFNDHTRGIDNNLLFKCETEYSDLFLLEARIQTDSSTNTQKLLCTLSLRPKYEESSSFPEIVIIKATLQSKDGSFYLEKQQPMNFDWGFVPIQFDSVSSI